MTVGELIEQLSKIDPNLSVERYVGQGSCELTSVFVTKKYVHTAEYLERERLRIEEAIARGVKIVSPSIDSDNYKNWEESNQHIVIIQ